VKPSRTSRVVPGFEPRDRRAWSVDVFRQVRRADLRTGYTGPKPSLIARACAAFRRVLRGAPTTP
jgi:hypothetical protein